MPFTPFHFGPAATIGIPLSERLDVFTFVLANVAVDVEPLVVMAWQLPYPVHGYAHCFLGASLVGALWGLASWHWRGAVRVIVQELLRFPFAPTRGKMVLSGILGACFHVLLDAPLYRDIKPFFPFAVNPLYGLADGAALYTFCTLCFVPALGLYAYRLIRHKGEKC